MGVWDELIESANASEAISKTVFIVGEFFFLVLFILETFINISTGGSKELQNSFIEKLYINNESFLDSNERNIISNNFFLGYTFIQYKDQNDEIISTLQIYTLPETFFQYLDLVLETLLKNVKLEELLVIPLLDYSETPNQWLKNLHKLFNEVQICDNQDSKPSILITVADKQTQIDWDPEIHEYIQLCLRSLSLIHNCSLIYVNLKQKNPKIIELVSWLLNLPIRINQKFKIEPSFVTDILIPKGFDTWGKIATLSDIVQPKQESVKWSLDNKENEFIQNYEKIVPPKHLTSSKVPKDKKEVEETMRTVVPLNEFLLGLYESKTQSNRVASVLSK